MRILLIEDDKIIGDGLAANLNLEGYAVDWVESIESAQDAFSANKYEMVILDIGLPDGFGIDFLKDIRSKKIQIPVIILTAYDDIKYKLSGFDSGADDYIIKPFQFSELCARIRAMRRRENSKADPLIKVHNITLNPAAKTVKKDDKEVIIGPKEFAILQILMEKAGKVISKTALEDSIYNWGNEIESNTIEVHIHGLRKKLGKDFIKTIKNMGYKIGESE